MNRRRKEQAKSNTFVLTNVPTHVFPNCWPIFVFSGSYLFFETSQRRRGDRVGLVSGFLEPNETVCLQFWYHMHGSHIGNLSVITRTNNTEGLVWQQSGEQGDAWSFGQTTLNAASRFQVAEQERFGLIWRPSKFLSRFWRTSHHRMPPIGCHRSWVFFVERRKRQKLLLFLK